MHSAGSSFWPYAEQLLRFFPGATCEKGMVFSASLQKLLGNG